MLVLTRKPQEKIRIGDHITITVLKTKGAGVRLGIEAPADVSVLRGELLAARDSFAADEPPTDSKPDETSQDQRRLDADETQVSHTRVSRSRVNSVLPNLLGEPGPLRELLAQRSGATAQH